MDNPVKFPIGGMEKTTPDYDINQPISIPVPSVGGPNDGDNPSIPDVSAFGNGPAVVKQSTTGGADDCPGMGAGC